MNAMHLKIHIKNLTRARLDTGRMAVDISKRTSVLAGHCSTVKRASSHHNPVQSEFLAYQWKHMVKSRNGHTAEVPYKFNIDSKNSKPKPQHYQGGKCVSSNSRHIYLLMPTKHTKSKCSDSLSNFHQTILPKGLSVSSLPTTLIHSFAYSWKKKEKWKNSSTPPVLWKPWLWSFL